MNAGNEQWRITFRRKAKRVMARLPADLKRRISQAIDQLAVNPHPPGSKRLVGAEDLYRIRVGGWRIVYAVKDDQLLILVVTVAPRGSAYRNL